MRSTNITKLYVNKREYRVGYALPVYWVVSDCVQGACVATCPPPCSSPPALQLLRHTPVAAAEHCVSRPAAATVARNHCPTCATVQHSTGLRYM